MLLSQGHVIYFGPTMGAIDYFSKQGFHIQKFQNPGDFFCKYRIFQEFLLNNQN